MRVARELLKGSRYDFFAVYLRGIDSLGHFAGRSSDLFGVAVDAGSRRYRPVLAEAYRRADEQLGELLSLVGGDTNVIVCSDHGFEWQSNGSFEHVFAPSGMVMLYGPDAAAGEQIGGAHVLDLAPTMLFLSGQPLARDMTGAVLTQGLRPGILQRRGVAHIASYDSTRRESRLPAEDGDASVVEQLRALGYIR
jgi:arylsulfatase A-like enzyme